MTVTVNSGDVRVGGTSLHIQINPTATYLLTDADPSASDAVAIDLAALGIAAGDVLRLQQVGAYDRDDGGPDPDAAVGMTGVFSTSATLLAAGNLDRVSGAVVS